jgi:hypothetical protein
LPSTAATSAQGLVEVAAEDLAQHADDEHVLADARLAE